MNDVTPKQQEFLARCIGQAQAANAAGRHDAALGWCRKALHILPELPEAWYHLGIAHSGKGQDAEATGALLKAAELASDDADAQNSIGLQLMNAGALAEAERCLRRSLALAPDFAFAHSNLGLLRKKQDRLDEAAAGFRAAIEREPRLAPAHANLGGVLNSLEDFAAGEAACRAALALDAGLAVGWCNLASALLGQYRLEEAQAACRRSLELKPGFADAHVVAAEILIARGQARNALAEYSAAIGRDARNWETHSARLFCLNYAAESSPAERLAAARRFEEVVSRNVTPHASWNCDPDPERRLRIGLVSGDFRRHPVGYLLRGPLRELDPSACEVVAYSSHSRRDELTQELESRCSAWNVVVGKSDAQFVRQVREDCIDILVDLSGHSAHNRLPAFARKPAPVQVTWLGYFATTGLKAIDWKIADPRLAPDSEEGHFVERIWRLPDTGICFSPPPDAPDVTAPPCQAADLTTYGCFNHLAKVNDAVIEAWARILRADGRARLLLKAKPLALAPQRKELVARFERRGVARDRLMLEGAGSYAEYLAAYGRVDIALDPFPYPGGMTTAESLWMGVPVVTLKGNRYIAHQGESLLHAAGLSEWIAASAEEYADIALAAAASRPTLVATRAGLREKVANSALFDAARFARHLEGAWRGMWRAWCASAAQAGSRP